MTIAGDLLATLLGMCFVVIGIRSLLGRRLVGRRSCGASWQAHGWSNILFGCFWLLVCAPGLTGVNGWPRVWIGLVGALCAVGALTVNLWTDWIEWESLRDR